MSQDLCITSEEKFVRAMANQHTHELGFIPHSVYGQALTRGTLRVTPEGTDFVGFVLHGPVKHHTRIWQTFTVEHRRRDQIATAAIDGACVIDGSRTRYQSMNEPAAASTAATAASPPGAKSRARRSEKYTPSRP